MQSPPENDSDRHETFVSGVALLLRGLPRPGRRTARPAVPLRPPLDIARVISIETPYDPYVCRIVDARMTYLDSAGETKVVAYRKLSAGCLLKT
ncbi:DUF2790 domain-containing protein [Azotobacter sp. CWF10]